MINATKEETDGLEMNDGELVKSLIRACGEGNDLNQQHTRIILENMGRSAVSPLVQALLHSDDPVIRLRAAEALGHIGDPRATEPLIFALGDRNTAVQWRAIEALVDIGEPARENLVLAIQNANADIRWGAKRALKDIALKKRQQKDEDYRARVRGVMA